MLRDYFKSLTFVAALLVGYTAIVLLHKKSPEPRSELRLETARAALPLQSHTTPSSNIAPPIQAADFND